MRMQIPMKLALLLLLCVGAIYCYSAVGCWKDDNGFLLRVDHVDYETIQAEFLAQVDETQQYVWHNVSGVFDGRRTLGFAVAWTIPEDVMSSTTVWSGFIRDENFMDTIWIRTTASDTMLKERTTGTSQFRYLSQLPQACTNLYLLHTYFGTEDGAFP